MKTINLVKLKIINFKGIQSLEIENLKPKTIISGDNGTKKTTIMDSYLWCLFGKDSTNRSDTNFNIKTLDSDGNPILNLNHEVSVTFNVDGKEITLKRCFREKWGVGKNDGKLLGHFTEYYINDVKLSTKKEYDAEVANIIPEEVFKMITNPLYFPSLPAETQKKLLFEMAGSISDEEISALKPEYAELLSMLSGQALSKFQRQIASKKSAINAEISGIPNRIDEVNRLMPETEDWDALQRELKEKESELAKIETELLDKSKAMKSEYERRSAIQEQIGKKKMERSQIESEIQSDANDANNKARVTIQGINHKIQAIDTDILNYESKLESIDKNINNIDNNLSVLRGKYKEINAEQLVIQEDEFICPTCKRPLEVADIESKQNELQANFNQRKSERLHANTKEGKTKVAEKAELLSSKDSLASKISDLKQQLTTLRGEKEILEKEVPEAKDVNALIQVDANWVRIGNEITDLENQLNFAVTTTDDYELNEGKQLLIQNIDELKKRLSKQDTIEKSKKRIVELEDIRTKSNQAIADLERIEFIATDFQKAKDNELTTRINGMFQLVSFSFISEQLNGNEKITCISTVNGVPYPDVNNAGKINAGLDIINAICKHKGISAPIFIDNSESVNELRHTISQIICLSVSKHPRLVMLDESTSDFVKL